MKKYAALACMLASLALPAFAACSKDDNAETLLPEEEITQTITPTEEPAPEEEQQEEPKTEVPVVIPENKPAVAQYVKITANSLNVRSGAGTNYTSLGTVEKNILMKYAGESNGWYETRYMGQKAFVSASYAQIVSLEKGSDEIEKIIEEGLNVLGAPYVYGATRLHDGKGNLIQGFTDKKFDCSSLMQFMFYKGAGVLLNMNTRTQVSQGREVTDDLKRGDLMFFTNASRKDNTGLERIGHVALYLGGNYILHTASDYAKIEQISSTRWSYYICARRMI